MNDPGFRGGGFLEPFLKKAMANLPARDLIDELVRRGWVLKERPRLILIAPKACSDAAADDRPPGLVDERGPIDSAGQPVDRSRKRGST